MRTTRLPSPLLPSCPQLGPASPHPAHAQGARWPALATGSGQRSSAPPGGQGHLGSPTPATWKFPFTWSPGPAHGRAARTRRPRAEGCCHAHRGARAPLAVGGIRSRVCLLNLQCSRGHRPPRRPVRRCRGRAIPSQGQGERPAPSYSGRFPRSLRAARKLRDCPWRARPEPTRPPKLAARPLPTPHGSEPAVANASAHGPVAAPSCLQGRVPGRRPTGSRRTTGSRGKEQVLTPLTRLVRGPRGRAGQRPGPLASASPAWGAGPVSPLQLSARVCGLFRRHRPVGS